MTNQVDARPAETPAGRSIRRFRAAVVPASDRLFGSGSASTFLLVALMAFPVALLFGRQPSASAIGGWITGMMLYAVSNLYVRGRILLDFERRLAGISWSFGGNIDSVTQEIGRAGSEGLSEEAARMLCIGLLHRIRQLTELMLHAQYTTKVRATLAVPIREIGSEEVTHLRVWCYDEPYGNRMWTPIPIGLPGSPRAYTERQIEIIGDLWALSSVEPGLRKRDFRSVASIPVMVGGPSGRCIAILNLDAATPHFFDVDHIQRLLPLAQPMINCIAFVLTSIAPKESFQFGA